MDIDALTDTLGLEKEFKNENELSDKQLWKIHKENLSRALTLSTIDPTQGRKHYEQARYARKALIKRGLWDGE